MIQAGKLIGTGLKGTGLVVWAFLKKSVVEMEASHIPLYIQELMRVNPPKPHGFQSLPLQSNTIAWLHITMDGNNIKISGTFVKDVYNLLSSIEVPAFPGFFPNVFTSAITPPSFNILSPKNISFECFNKGNELFNNFTYIGQGFYPIKTDLLSYIVSHYHGIGAFSVGALAWLVHILYANKSSLLNLGAKVDTYLSSIPQSLTNIRVYLADITARDSNILPDREQLVHRFRTSLELLQDIRSGATSPYADFFEIQQISVYAVYTALLELNQGFSEGYPRLSESFARLLAALRFYSRLEGHGRSPQTWRMYLAHESSAAKTLVSGLLENSFQEALDSLENILNILEPEANPSEVEANPSDSEANPSESKDSSQ
jgi:hypothetical protein